jgi:hypothetical protein
MPPGACRAAFAFAQAFRDQGEWKGVRAEVTDCQYVAISGLWVQCQQATALKNRARAMERAPGA